MNKNIKKLFFSSSAISTFCLKKLSLQLYIRILTADLKKYFLLGSIQFYLISHYSNQTHLDKKNLIKLFFPLQNK